MAAQHACQLPALGVGIIGRHARLQSGVMFGVTHGMRRWAAVSTNDSTHTIVLAAYLTPLNGAGSQQIAGSFSQQGSSTRNLFVQVSAFVDRSAAAFASGSVTLHVVHDRPAFESGIPCVHFHRFGDLDDELEAQIRFRSAATDRRWPLYTNVLRKLDKQQSRWDCMWAVDLTDVVMLRLPPCSALPEDRIVMGRDGLEWMAQRRWFGWLGREGRVQDIWPGFGRWLATSKAPVLNNGILGGRRPAIVPVLNFTAHQVAAMWLRPGITSNWSIDMLVSNQAVYDPAVRRQVQPESPTMALASWRDHLAGSGQRQPSQESDQDQESSGLSPLVPIGGYPEGPLSLPMWGELERHARLEAGEEGGGDRHGNASSNAHNNQRNGHSYVNANGHGHGSVHSAVAFSNDHHSGGGRTDTTTDSFESPWRHFHVGVLAALTNASFMMSAVVAPELTHEKVHDVQSDTDDLKAAALASWRPSARRRAAWWCASERFDCRHSFLRATRGLFWFAPRTRDSHALRLPPLPRPAQRTPRTAHTDTHTQSFVHQEHPSRLLSACYDSMLPGSRLCHGVQVWPQAAKKLVGPATRPPRRATPPCAVRAQGATVRAHPHWRGVLLARSRQQHSRLRSQPQSAHPPHQRRLC